MKLTLFGFTLELRKVRPSRSDGNVHVVVSSEDKALAKHIGEILTTNVKRGYGSLKRPPALWFGFPPDS